MIVYDLGIKVRDTEIFPQHTIADLNLWPCIYCFVQSGEHIHTRAHASTN